jgi:hypothetical protein
MPGHPFDHPISVDGGPQGLTVLIGTVEQAAESLLNWHDHTPAWRRAVQVCHEAMSGSATAAEARQAFIEAAQEAGRV